MLDDILIQIAPVDWHHGVAAKCIVSKDNYFLYCNPAFCRLVEYTEAELRKMRFRDITLPSDIDADEAEAAAIARGEKQEYEMTKTYITKTGKHVLIALRVWRIDDANGQLDFFYSQITPKLPRMPYLAPEAIASPIIKRNWGELIQSWWKPALAFLAALAFLIAETIKAI